MRLEDLLTIKEVLQKKLNEAQLGVAPTQNIPEHSGGSGEVLVNMIARIEARDLATEIELINCALLIEEKRRLLTCIIKWMSVTALNPRILKDFCWLIRTHKRVNSATTMEELSVIGAELTAEVTKFKQNYSEPAE